MPRKRITMTDGYNKAFPKALRLLMRERNITQQELAEYIGKKRQTVSYYCDGASSPDWETLVKISSFFSVSTDWLLGIVDNPSPDQSIVAVCQYTGLSPATAGLLHAYKSTGFIPSLIDAILNADGIPEDLPEAISESAQALAISLARGISDILGIEREINNSVATISMNGKNEYYISAEHAAELFLSRAIDIATINITDAIRNMRDNAAAKVFDPKNADALSVEIELYKVDESDVPSE